MRIIDSRILTKVIRTFLYFGKYFKVLLSIIPISPISANIKITERCNSRCITCNVWENKYDNECNTLEFESILKQMRQNGIEIIRFTGGEPLLRDDLGDLIRIARNLGFASIAVQTNGLLLSKKAEELIENGITILRVSVDGMSETHNQIRGTPNGFEKSIDGIKVFSKISQEKNKIVDIGINTTLSNLNIQEIPDLIKLCKALNITWGINLLDENPYFFKNKDMVSLHIKEGKLIDDMINYIKHAKKKMPEVITLDKYSLDYVRDYLKNKVKEPPCVHGYFDVFLNSSGDVYSGCWVLKPIGNLKKYRLTDILSSPEYKRRSKNMFLRKCPGCTCGFMVNVKFNKLPFFLLNRFKNGIKINLTD